ncbi:hypothetical protein GYMLUDRAFT_264960 [Collybiopsis luxurians FD-317 M1]|uniref:Uncharacterized protein n=1 Tax=Collybiopsis luxurians FD-317 M1 TaxID=944289 RepID=A0A0D0BGE3_9AGAR|nr:hypothetical protein GYMLUDRAFT_264960 [Collybiopsis luxurians FD-317 M1]
MMYWFERGGILIHIFNLPPSLMREYFIPTQLLHVKAQTSRYYRLFADEADSVDTTSASTSTGAGPGPGPGPEEGTNPSSKIKRRLVDVQQAALASDEEFVSFDGGAFAEYVDGDVRAFSPLSSPGPVLCPSLHSLSPALSLFLSSSCPRAVTN